MRALLWTSAVFLAATLGFILTDNLNFIFPFYVGFGDLVLGLFVLRHNPRNKINLTFGLITFFVFLWTLAIFFYNQSTASQEALWWSRIAAAASACIPIWFLFFTFFFPKEDQSTSFPAIIIGGSVSVLLVFFSLSNLVVREAAVTPAGPIIVTGRGFGWFILYFIGLAGWAFFELARKYYRSNDNNRLQIKYVFTGFLLGTLFPVITNLVLPYFGRSEFAGFGPFFIIITLAFITYSIVKHRLMSIDVVIRRGFAYTLSSVLIIACYALAVYLSEYSLKATLGYRSVFATAFLVFIIAALFQPLLRLIQEFADRVFLRHKYDYQKALHRVSREISRKIKIEELAALIISTFLDVMRVSEISFLILDKDKSNFESVDLPALAADPRYKKLWIDAGGSIARLLMETKEIIKLDELKDVLPFNFKLLIPVISDDKLVAIISLGDKLSEDVFSPEDMRLLHTLADQTALALENVHLYQEVLEMKDYNQNILDSLVYGVLTTDQHGIIRSLNPAMRQLIGRADEEIEGRSYREVFTSKSPLCSSIESTLKNKCIFNFEASLLHKERGLIPIMINTTLLETQGEKNGVLLTARDLTEIKELENKIRQADKLKALGTMSAGMAHEIKNPLSSLRILSQLLPIKYDDSEFRKKLMEIVPQEVSRIDRIVESLLKFARTSRMKLEPVSLNEYLDGILKNYLRQAEEGHVEIVKNYAALPKIMIDPDQLVQVFTNLFVNGIQAMPEGGRLTVTTRIGKQLENFIQTVEIIVSDTGHGISQENLKHLFDPFFTTKHEGTGLGLTIAHSIIDAHQGEIKVESRLGAGTVFKISLPVQQ